MMARISRAVLLVCVAVATGLGAGLCQDAVDDMEQLVVAHPSLPWPEWRIPNHPLGPIVRSILGGEVGPQPAWKLPMLVNGLQKEPMICTITGYSSQSAGGGGGVYTRWGSRVKWAAGQHGPGR